MSKIRNTLIGAAAVVAPLALMASPAGAAQAHPKYVAAVRHIAPKLTKGDSNQKLTALGEAVCSDLNSGDTVAYVAVEFLDSTANPFTSYQDGEIIGASVVYLCPSYIPALKLFIQQESGGGSVTTSYVAPTGFAPYRILATVVSGGTILHPATAA